MSLNQLTIELANILDEMKVPELRKVINKENLQWLVRNLGINNSNDRNFTKAMTLIHRILSE